MRDKVAVVGVGCTKFGERYDRGYEELICDAAFAAYDDAGIDPDEIEAAYLGTYIPGPGGGKSSSGTGFGWPPPTCRSIGSPSSSSPAT